MKRAPSSYDVPDTRPFHVLLAGFCVVLALSLANSTLSAAFLGIWERTLNIGFDRWQRFRTVGQWIDDMLVPLLFLSLGLRVKRNLRARSPARSGTETRSLSASLGAASIPLLIYGGAVLTALAFTSPELSPSGIELAIGLTALLVILNQLNVGRLSVYLLAGVLLWLALLQGGVPPALAGIVLASTIPCSVPVDDEAFVERTGLAMESFERAAGPRIEPWLSRRQFAMQMLIEGVRESQSPLFRLEPVLLSVVGVFILPVFLLANAGITFGPATFHSISWVLVTTVATGFLLGNGAAAVRPTPPERPVDRSRHELAYGRQVSPASAGWRMTMALAVGLFTARVVFRDPSALDSARIGILAGAGVSGLFYWWSREGDARASREMVSAEVSPRNQPWHSPGTVQR